MKNSLEDVKNHLIMAMERLNDDELMQDEEKGKLEIEKARTLSLLSNSILQVEESEIDKEELEISKKRLQLDAMKIADSMGYVYKVEGMELKKIGGRNV